jgi:ribosomal protein S18 acetylase RimI-like enzyme
MICGKLDELVQYHVQILKLVSSFRKKKISLTALAKETPDDTRYCLLIKNKQLVGMYRYYKVTRDFIKDHDLAIKYWTYWQIATVIVDPKHRGKGYGKTLMKHASKLGNMVLDTYLSWLPAMKTYLSAGYKIVSTKKDTDDYLVVFSNN